MEAEANSNYNMKSKEKIQRVFKKFLDPNFKIRNDVYLNLLLTHLVGKKGDLKFCQRSREPFCQWVIEVSSLWDKQKVSPPVAILSFTLNFVSQLSADEQIFVKLNCQNVYESLVGIAQRNSKDHSVTFGLVTLFCSFLEHKSGILWLMATNHWTNMVDLGIKAHTLFIRKKANQFVRKLLEKTISVNRKFSINVLEILIKPLKNVLSLPGNQSPHPTQMECRKLCEPLKSNLELILEVVEAQLKTYNKELLQLFFEQDTPEIIKKILYLPQSEELSFKLLQIECVFLLFDLSEKVNGKKVVPHDSLSLFNFKVMFDLIKREMDKNSVKCIVQSCDYAHELFCCLVPRMPIFTKKEWTVEFQMQCIFLQMSPLFAFSFQMLKHAKAASLLLNDVFRNDFCHKWLKMSVVQGIEISYKWVQQLHTKPDLVDDIIFCLEYIVKMQRLLNKERASIVFSPCVYSLTDALTCLKQSQMKISPSWALYFRTIVDAIVDLVETFDLTWKDTVETICVLDLAYEFLQYPYWPDNILIIKGLKLLKTAISKYMSPDLALLQSKGDSKVFETGSLLYAKCHDSSWEIRDSALEVVYAFSINATKFPAYSNILLNSELPHLVVNMAFKDDEFYVRATAFKCLQELIQIPEIWELLLDVDTFLDNILDVFKNETEGIVRKEAATLVHKIDKTQEFPEAILPRVYDVMTHAATEDLHWEVKYNALDFWFNLWEQHLVHQGMIDHIFPSHTFSKENKKIVELNEAEVRKRIIKVLNQLSHIGCLHVMRCAIQDECDIEVSKKATSFAFSMLKMLKMYKVVCEDADLSEPPSPVVVHNNIRNNQIFEQRSPSNSSSLIAPSPASTGNLGTSENRQQLGASLFFDTVSPFPAPHSPSLDLAVTSVSSATPQISQNSLQQIQSPPGNDIYHQQDSVTSGTQLDSPFHDSIRNQIISGLNLSNGIDMFDCDEHDASELEYLAHPNNFDPVQTEQVLNEVVNSNDMALLQKIHNSSDQETNNIIQMKTKAYLAPSEYLKFVYNEIESYAMGKTQWMNKLDEFDSLLDDILKDYNAVADNSMDCY